MTTVDELNEFLSHEGVKRKSGRYPWGSGKDPHQRQKTFLDSVSELEKQGLSATEVAKGLGLTTTQLRAFKSIAKNEQKKALQSKALGFKAKNMSNVAIGQRMGINESSVRDLLKESSQIKAAQHITTSDMIRDAVKEHRYVDIGTAVENQIGISSTQLSTAVAILQGEGYNIHKFSAPQLGTGLNTTIKVLAEPDVTYKELLDNRDKIGSIMAQTENNGLNYDKMQPPLNINSDRVEVRYGSQGGSDMDGVLQIRRGVDDISLGGAKYAQVRVAVDGTHYIKGMAIYADDLPDGVDIRFNTNKEDKGDKLKALKPQKDELNPFGAIVHQQFAKDPAGNVIRDKDGNATLVSAMNIVNEEGDWDKWSKNISSQVLSKQSVALAQKQLDLKFKTKVDEIAEINALTNPAVKKKLLESAIDDLDSSAVHLKAAALPRQRTQVILPVNTLKDTEVYAPNFRNGEKVVLVRYPHGGIFEIPELTVNNKNKEAQAILTDADGTAKDAVGINSTVAGRLSGADFDGDTVLVIPNNNRSVRTASPLAALKDFDPQREYQKYEGMTVMSPKLKQQKMGDVSNLITDMTIKDAPHSEIARAVKHSMVVIDAEKHELNWKQSAIDNGIAELKRKYQGDARSGATTLVSRASSPIDVDNRKPRPMADGGPIDPVTGERVFVPTGENYIKPAFTRVTKTGKTTEVPEEVVYNSFKSKKAAETNDLRTLSSGTPIEEVYANHGNRLKALANESRKEYYNIKPLPYSPTAKKTYAAEVASLNAKLNLALKNKPLERKAQLIADVNFRAKKQADPNMDDAQKRKERGLALTQARERVGADKPPILFEGREWEAVQSGAITNNKMEAILSNAKLEQVKSLATPRSALAMSTTKVARAKAMAASGYTQSEIADQLGVSVSTLSTSLNPKS